MNRDMLYISLSPWAKALVDRHTLIYDCVPDGLIGKTILFLADVHMSWMMPESNVLRLFRQIEALHPDLILWGGDYAESREGTARFFSLTRTLKPPMGMFGVVGNNDHENFPDGVGALKKMAAEGGVRILINRAHTEAVQGGTLMIAGADELEYGLPSGRMLYGQVGKRDLRILVAHSPQSLDLVLKNVPRKPQIALCGHTHGGQIKIGPLSPYTFGYERSMRKHSEYFFVSGLKNTQGMDVLVSGGVGASVLPLRVGVPPRMHLLTLSRG